MWPSFLSEVSSVPRHYFRGSFLDIFRKYWGDQHLPQLSVFRYLGPTHGKYRNFSQSRYRSQRRQKPTIPQQISVVFHTTTNGKLIHEVKSTHIQVLRCPAKPLLFSQIQNHQKVTAPWRSWSSYPDTGLDLTDERCRCKLLPVTDFPCTSSRRKKNGYSVF